MALYAIGLKHHVEIRQSPTKPVPVETSFTKKMVTEVFDAWEYRPRKVTKEVTFKGIYYEGGETLGAIKKARYRTLVDGPAPHEGEILKVDDLSLVRKIERALRND